MDEIYLNRKQRWSGVDPVVVERERNARDLLRKTEILNPALDDSDYVFDVQTVGEVMQSAGLTKAEWKFLEAKYKTVLADFRKVGTESYELRLGVLLRETKTELLKDFTPAEQLRRVKLAQQAARMRASRGPMSEETKTRMSAAQRQRRAKEENN